MARFLQENADVFVWLPSPGEGRRGYPPLPGTVIQEQPLVIQLDEGVESPVPAGQLAGGLIRVTSPERNSGVVDVVFTREQAPGRWELQKKGSIEDRAHVRVDTQVLFSVRVNTEVIVGIKNLGGGVSSDEPDAEVSAQLSREDLESAFPELSRISGVGEEVEALLEKLASELFSLKLRVQSMDEQDLDGKKRMRTVNLSGSGLKFWTTTNYQQGAQLVFDLTLDDDQHLLLMSTVVRVESIKQEGRKSSNTYGVACEFVELSEAARERIISFAFKKQREALRYRRERKEQR